jgi:hypothetical protein
VSKDEGVGANPRRYWVYEHRVILKAPVGSVRRLFKLATPLTQGQGVFGAILRLIDLQLRRAQLGSLSHLPADNIPAYRLCMDPALEAEAAMTKLMLLVGLLATLALLDPMYAIRLVGPQAAWVGNKISSAADVGRALPQWSFFRGR